MKISNCCGAPVRETRQQYGTKRTCGKCTKPCEITTPEEYKQDQKRKRL